MAEVRRQNAHTAAHVVFERAKADINAAHAAKYQRTRANHDERCHDLGDPHLAQATQEFNQAKRTPPNFKAALDALGTAVAKADQDYHTTVAALGAKHGVGQQQNRRP
jgi:hypothetical protein